MKICGNSLSDFHIFHKLLASGDNKAAVSILHALSCFLLLAGSSSPAALSALDWLGQHSIPLPTQCSLSERL